MRSEEGEGKGGVDQNFPHFNLHHFYEIVTAGFSINITFFYVVALFFVRRVWDCTANSHNMVLICDCPRTGLRNMETMNFSFFLSCILLEIPSPSLSPHHPPSPLLLQTSCCHRSHKWRHFPVKHKSKSIVSVFLSTWNFKVSPRPFTPLCSFRPPAVIDHPNGALPSEKHKSESVAHQVIEWGG